MSNSSQQTTLSDISIKDLLISDSSNIDSITLGSTMSYSGSTFTIDTTSIGAAQPVYTINTSNTITLTGSGDYNISQMDFNFGNQEWEDSFPSWHRVQDMCEKYPGLKIAFDNFKVFYEMVKDDYDNPTPKK